jgi:hypothetical protein
MGQKAMIRQGLLGYPYQIEAVRATPVLKGTFPSALVPAGAGGNFGGANANVKAFRADQGKACLRAQCTTAAGHKRQLYLRACPDSWIERNAANVNNFDLSDPVLVARWNAWIASLQAAPALQIQYRAQPGAALRTIRSVTTDGGTGMYAVETTAAHNFAVGQLVITRNVRGVNVDNLRGPRKVVRVVDATNVVLDATPMAAPPIALSSVATIYPLVYSYSPISEGTVLGVTTRKIGRPFGQQAGR